MERPEGEVKSEDFGFEAGEVLMRSQLPEPFLEVSTSSKSSIGIWIGRRH